MGTPEFGVPALNYLIENTNVVLVVTQPDAKVGRKKEIVFSSIKKIAIENNIQVFQPTNIKKEYEEIKECNPDLIITAAYGQIVPVEVLNIPKIAAFNLHGSILPKYRGAAPIQWSLINGDEETGVSLMYMEKGMDTGNVVDIKKIKIDYQDNFISLYNKLSIVAKEVLEDNLESIIKLENKSIAQEESEVTYARMLNRDDEYIDFNSDTNTIYNKVRGLYPNAYFVLNNENVKALEIEIDKCDVSIPSIVKDITKNDFKITCSDGIVILKKVKPSGKKEMDIKSFINGLDKDKLIGAVVNE